MRRRASRTVLIVSEEPDQPGINTAFLHQPDIRLLSCYPDDQGLEIANQEHPSLIVDELAGPIHAGPEFCRELRNNPTTCSIPLIVVSPPEMRDEAMDLCADQLLLKPLVRRELFDACCRFIRLPERRHRRAVINLRFTYHPNNQVRQAFSRDLSKNGAFLKTDRMLPLGTQVDLSFRLPGAWQEIRCRGVVRSNCEGERHSAHQSGFGIEFAEIADSDVALLEDFIERQTQRPLRPR